MSFRSGAREAGELRLRRACDEYEKDQDR